MEPRTRITTVGKVLIGLLLVALILTFTGSSTLQIIGFIAIVIIVIVVASDRLTLRFSHYGHLTSGRADTGPRLTLGRDPFTGVENVEGGDEPWRREVIADPNDPERESVLERETARYRERLREHSGE